MPSEDQEEKHVFDYSFHPLTVSGSEDFLSFGFWLVYFVAHKESLFNILVQFLLELT